MPPTFPTSSSRGVFRFWSIDLVYEILYVGSLPLHKCVTLNFGGRIAQSVLGAILLVIAAWIRVCGTINTLSSSGTFALFLVAQLFVGVVAPCFQVVGPRYAEVWFDLKGRATATMIVAICTYSFNCSLLGKLAV